MRQQTTDFGLACLGQVPWGTHVCHFYDDPSEIIEVVVPYLTAGLRQQECCMWVCSAHSEVDRAIEAMKEAMQDFPARLASGQIRILPYDEWYLGEDGSFDSAQVLRRWSERLAEVVSAGYRGLRVVGDTSWLDQGLWAEFDKYEAKLYGSIGQDPMLALCLYPRHGEWLPDPVEVAKSHQYALMRRDCELRVVECSKHWDTLWMSLFDGLSEGLLIVDESGMIRAANSSLLDTFAVESLDDLGADLDELSRRFSFCHDSGTVPSQLSEILRSKPGSQQYWKAALAGTRGEMSFSVRAREISSSSWLSGRFVVVLEDITELRKIERAKDQLLHVMSHEFRNPLQVMKVAVKLLSANQLGDGPAPERYVKIVNSQIDHLSSLVEDALTACRIEEKTMATNWIDTDLVDLVGEWIDSTVTPLDHVLIQLFSRETRAPVRVDQMRIRQILSNILGNAIKYTPAGRRIWVDIRPSDSHVIVKVEDEGIGIPLDEFEMVFQPFYRASNSADYSKDGAGLGLYVSRELARLHGGEMWVEARPEAGTVVNLRLPLSTG